MAVLWLKKKNTPKSFLGGLHVHKLGSILALVLLGALTWFQKGAGNLTIAKGPQELDGKKPLRIHVGQDDPTMRRGDWDTSPIVIRKLKLVFFAVPKNACEEFKKLFRRIEGYADWNTSWNHPPQLYHPEKPFTTLPHDPGRNGLTYLSNLEVDEANAIINDRAWTKAIFLRDPLIRFLSAYIDKIVRHNDDPSTFGLTFKGFVGRVESGHKNVHWGAQCDLIDCAKWLPAMDFMGSFENLANDTEALLRRLGAWEEYGMTGWGPDGTSAMFRGPKNDVHAANTDAITRNYYNERNVIERVKQLMEKDLMFINTTIN
jgi:hypothetical protein